MLESPELIQDMIRQTRSHTNLPVSIKIRLKPELRDTIELVRRAESAGAAWITVHGRTKFQKPSDPPNPAQVKMVPHLNIDFISIVLSSCLDRSRKLYLYRYYGMQMYFVWPMSTPL